MVSTEKKTDGTDVYKRQDVGIDKFRQVLKRTETDYLVLPVDLTNHDYIRQAGCTPIAQTEKYVVYRFEG